MKGILLLVSLVCALHTTAVVADQCTYVAPSGVTIDLTPLARNVSGSFLSVQDVTGEYPYLYQFSPCGALPNTTSCHSTSESEICQTLNGQFVANVAQYSGLNSLVPIDPNDLSQGFKVSFSSGDACFPTTANRTATISYVCGDQLIGPISVNSTQCDYEFVVSTSAACVAAPTCGVTAFGHQFDLQKLTALPNTVDYTSPVSADGYQYEVNPCGTVTSKTPGCDGALMCRLPTGTQPSLIIARDWSAGTWGLQNPYNPYEGVSYSISNGDSCYPGSKPSALTIHFICSLAPVGTLDVYTGEDSCVYSLTFPTYYACYQKDGSRLEMLEELKEKLSNVRIL